jgi:hypothetical protein
VGLGDVLFGRKKLKGANLDRLFALSTAQITLETELGVKPDRVAAVVFKPLSAGEFMQAERDLDELLGVAAADSGSKVRRRSDSLGFQWIVIHDSDFEDLVTTTHLVSSELQARGFGGQLLAAIFKFRGGDHPVFLIYGYKTATFWPFVPTGKEQERDNAEELKLKAELEKELPIEPDLREAGDLHDVAEVWRVDELPVPDVDTDVGAAVEEDNVARPQVLAPDRTALAPEHPARVWERDVELPVDVHDEAGAVEPCRARSGPSVGRAEIAKRDRDGLLAGRGPHLDGPCRPDSFVGAVGRGHCSRWGGEQQDQHNEGCGKTTAHEMRNLSRGEVAFFGHPARDLYRLPRSRHVGGGQKRNGQEGDLAVSCARTLLYIRRCCSGEKLAASWG